MPPDEAEEALDPELDSDDDPPLGIRPAREKEKTREKSAHFDHKHQCIAGG